MKTYNLPAKKNIELCYNPDLINPEKTKELIILLSNLRMKMYNKEDKPSEEGSMYINTLLEQYADPRASDIQGHTVLQYLMDLRLYDLVVKVLKMGVFSEGLLAPCLARALRLRPNDRYSYNQEILSLLKKQGFSEKERSPEFILHTYNNMKKQILSLKLCNNHELLSKCEESFTKKLEYLSSP